MVRQAVIYLEKMDIVEINRKTLELHKEIEDFHLMMPADLEFCVAFAKNTPGEDLYRISLAYCVSLIVLHPFKNGNHRTSLYAAELFLIRNGCEFRGDMDSHKGIQKWRIEHEERLGLEKRFAQVTATDSPKAFAAEINRIMGEEYGLRILNWLRESYG